MSWRAGGQTEPGAELGVGSGQGHRTLEAPEKAGWGQRRWAEPDLGLNLKGKLYGLGVYWWSRHDHY